MSEELTQLRELATNVAWIIQSPKINLVFQNWLSLGIIVALILGFIAWVTYIAISVARIKHDMHQAITKTELAEAFEAFRKEIQG